MDMFDTDNSNVVYAYTPESWDEKRWRELGAFTVVFLNFEKEKMIRRSVASALEQDYPLLEMFFMDDASQDGSGDVMEALVREYRGRHKVTVVRNKKNVGICGQWNAVAKLAKGEWLGMFCADDIAHRDRVSVVAERIKKYPSLLGICTDHEYYDARTGLRRAELKAKAEIVLANGDDSPDVLLKKRWAVGSTSFYRRSLFDVPLPSVPFDDILIKWRLHMRAIGISAPVWMFDPTVRTIDYFVGEGLWSSVQASQPNDISDREWKEKKSVLMKNARRRFVESWMSVLMEALAIRSDGGFVGVALKEIFRHRGMSLRFDGVGPYECGLKDGFSSRLASILVNESSDKEKYVSVLCDVSASLQNEIYDLNDVIREMRGSIKKLKKGKRRKNRIIAVLIFMTLLAMLVIFMCIP